MRAKIKKAALGLGADILGSLLLAVGIYCFSEKINIAPGGVSGVAIMIKYLTSLPVGLMNLAMNVPLLLLAFGFMGWRFTLRTVRTLVFNSLILDLLVTPFFPQYAGDRLLGSIFAGVFMGAGLGVIFFSGSTTAGTDIISFLIERRFPDIRIGTALLLIDGAVLASSALVFGDIESVLFGAVALFCQTRIIDAIVYGADKGHMVLVISSRSEAIAARIIAEMNRSATFLNGAGAFSGEPTRVLMCVFQPREYRRLRDIVAEEDGSAFVVLADAARVMGEGFKSIGT